MSTNANTLSGVPVGIDEIRNAAERIKPSGAPARR